MLPDEKDALSGNRILARELHLQRGMNLVDRVVQRIGQDIVSNVYPLNAPLPNETEWCEQLGISRSVLREAVRVLVSKNLMATRVRTGGRIRPRSEWNVLDPDILGWLSHGGDQAKFSRELFELRRIIEPAAARIAAERITPDQVAELRRCCESMASAGEDAEQFIKPDNLFHSTILAAVDNSLFDGLSQTIMVALEMSLRMSLHAPRGLQRSVPQHRIICEALAKRDGEAAHAATIELVDESARDAMEAMGFAEHA